MINSFNDDNDKLNNEILNIYNHFISMHGIKPNNEELITINDNINIMIYKFINWYNRAYDFALGDYRDLNGFIKINEKFINNTYKFLTENNSLKNDIEENNFIIIMIKYIKNETDFFFPSFIINIVNVRFIDITSVIFDICTINNDIILSDIKFDLSLKINILYNDIFNRIKLIKFLIDKNQLKILYQNELILCNNNELMTIFNNLLI